jgi:hypothetical protein
MFPLKPSMPGTRISRPGAYTDSLTTELRNPPVKSSTNEKMIITGNVSSTMRQGDFATGIYSFGLRINKL